MFLSPRGARNQMLQEGLECPSYETLRSMATQGLIRATRFQQYWMIDLDALRGKLQRGEIVDGRRKKGTVGLHRRTSGHGTRRLPQ